MQGSGLPIEPHPIPVIQAVGHIGRCLHLGNNKPTPQRVDRTAGQVKAVAYCGWTGGQQFAKGGGSASGFCVGRRDSGAKVDENLGSGLGVQDVPGFVFDTGLPGLSGIGFWMNLNAEVPAGVEKI
jgi:hypothetical protein